MIYNDFNKIFDNKKNLLLSEYKDLSNFYVEIARLKEKNIIKFNSKYIVRNKKDNRIYILKNDFKNYLKKYFNTIIQRLIYNKKIAEKENLIPYFITFTLPSEYHTFKTYNKKNVNDWELNPNFKFQDIKTAITSGYNQLNIIFRYFYLNLKSYKRNLRNQMKKLRYNAFFEYHKSFLPHLHILIYIPSGKEFENLINEIYIKTLKKFNMNFKANKLIKINDMEQNENEKENKLNKLDGAVLYISKYISKNLKELFEIPDDLDNLKDILDNEKFEKFKIKEKELYKYIGWKIFHNIRIFRGNNTRIGIKNYEKIYYSLDTKEKENLLKRTKKNKSCLLFEIEKLIVRYTKIFSNNKKVNKKIFKNSFKYKIIEIKERIKKVRYTEIFNLFNIINLFDKLNGIPEFFLIFKPNRILNIKKNFIFETDRNWYIYKEFNNFINIFKRYIRIFNFFIKTHFDKELDIYFDRKKINRELNNIQNNYLKSLLNYFEGNENIFKKFINEFYKAFNLFKKNKRYWEKYKNIINKVEKELNEYFENYKKWLDTDLSFASIFFYDYYKLIKYKIFKNNNEIYNKNNFVLELL